MIEYISPEIIWRIIGFIALIFVFFAFKETNDKKLIIYLAIGSFFWGFHFWFLWLISASLINFFDVFKNLIWLKYKKNNYWISFFVSSYIIIWLYTYLDTGKIISFFPTIASILWAIAVFIFQWVYLRFILLSTLFIWFSYNFIGWSYAGMSSDIALIWASLYGIYKIKYSTKKEK